MACHHQNACFRPQRYQNGTCTRSNRMVHQRAAKVRQNGASESCTRKLHQKVAPEGCTRRLHQKAAPESCARRLHQKAAPEGCTRRLHQKAAPKSFSKNCKKQVHNGDPLAGLCIWNLHLQKKTAFLPHLYFFLIPPFCF